MDFKPNKHYSMVTNMLGHKPVYVCEIVNKHTLEVHTKHVLSAPVHFLNVLVSLKGLSVIVDPLALG